MTDQILAGVRAEADRATVHVEDVYDTSVEDLWAAVTEPDRLARWIAEVSGDLRLGGGFRIRFTSSWDGLGSVLACEPPHRLMVATREESGSETVIEALVSQEGDRARLVVEERGLPVDDAPYHAAGWQVHLEDLGAMLAGREPSDWRTRWTELKPAYGIEG